PGARARRGLRSGPAGVGVGAGPPECAAGTGRGGLWLWWTCKHPPHAAYDRPVGALSGLCERQRDGGGRAAATDCAYSQTIPSLSASPYQVYSGSEPRRYGPYPAAFASRHVPKRGSVPPPGDATTEGLGAEVGTP